MAEHLNALNGTALDAAALSMAFSVANGVGPITMISGGAINDRLGPRLVILSGGVLFGLGMLLSSFARSAAALIAFYGLGCGLGMGMVYGCTVNTCVKLFPDRRGLIGGLTTATYGLSSVVIPPVASAVIAASGVTAAFRLLGIAFILVICLCAILVSPGPAPEIPAGRQDAGRDADWRGMLKSGSFYLMIVMLTCGAVAGLMMISQASSVAQNMAGFSVSGASAIVSVIALFNVGGRVAAGYVSDKLGRVKTLSCAMLLSVAALLALFCLGSGPIAFSVCTAAVGLCFGALMGIYPGFTAEQFGTRHNTVNYGIMFIGFAAAGIIGPSVMSSVYARTHIYTPAISVAIALSVAAFALSILWQMLYAKRKKQPDNSN